LNNEGIASIFIIIIDQVAMDEKALPIEPTLSLHADQMDTPEPPEMTLNYRVGHCLPWPVDQVNLCLSLETCVN